MVYREQNRIIFTEAVYAGDLPISLAALHQGEKAGYSDFILDFTSCTAAFAPPMLGLCAQVMKRRCQQTDFSLILPREPRLARLFHNANWAHFLAPDDFPASQFRGYTMVPATQYQTSDEQYQAVNRIINGILGAIPSLARSQLAALEWSVNEITDNVLVHAQSPIGGLVQVSTFQRLKQRIEYIVVDAGIGIPGTLRPSHPELSSDAAALEKAIREGVTRDKNLGQGNGLFGSYQVCSHSMGSFHLESLYGKLALSEKGLRVTTEKIPFAGTLIAAQINFSDPRLLEEALQFGGRPSVITDYVELFYEKRDSDELVVTMKNEADSFGSRIAGTPIRNKLLNFVHMCPDRRIVVDFSGIPLVSSSFADEVLGKLFKELGPLTFAKRFDFRNVEPTVKQLIDKAITQRLSTT